MQSTNSEETVVGQLKLSWNNISLNILQSLLWVPRGRNGLRDAWTEHHLKLIVLRGMKLLGRNNRKVGADGKLFLSLSDFFKILLFFYFCFLLRPLFRHNE